MQYKRVLTIAGSDPSGGAGIEADIKTISALGCYASAAITAVVNENTMGVYGIHEIPVDMVTGQIKSVLDDIGADAIKIGMLYSPELITAIATTLKQYDIRNIVVDPVMVATSGDTLMAADIAEAVKSELLPLARIVTPNMPEASKLLGGREISSVDDMRQASADISFDKLSVLVKGGHMTDKNLVDILCDAEAEAFIDFPSDKIETRNTHGTGCTLSSAIACGLAQGKSILGAVTEAKVYINEAIASGAAYEIGHGHGPVHHFCRQWQ